METTSQQEPSQSDNVKRKLTVKRDKFDPRDLVAFTTGPLVLPPEFSLKEYLGPVRDQGDLGSCTGHAAMGIADLLVRKFFKYIPDKSVIAQDVDLSPMFQYYNERLIDGDVSADDGSSGRTMMRALVKYGICLEKDWPYNLANFTVKPTDEAYTRAKSYKPGAYHRVLDVETAKSVIYSGYPFSVSSEVYASFMSDEVAKTGLIPVPGPNEEYEGGHEFYSYGYSDTKIMADGIPGGFVCRNSWGTSWGLQGDMWLPYRYMGNSQLISDLWTCHLGKPWHKQLTLEQHAKLFN